jgi:hypothetical protein
MVETFEVRRVVSLGPLGDTVEAVDGMWRDERVVSRD